MPPEVPQPISLVCIIKFGLYHGILSVDEKQYCTDICSEVVTKMEETFSTHHWYKDSISCQEQFLMNLVPYAINGQKRAENRMIRFVET